MCSCGASGSQGFLDGFQHVMMDVDTHEMGLKEVFLDLEHTTEAICEDIDVWVVVESFLNSYQDSS